MIRHRLGYNYHMPARFFYLFLVVLPFLITQMIITRAVEGGWPCQSDIDSLCSHVRYGSQAEKERCLKEHESQLSDVCQKSRKAKTERKEKRNSACEVAAAGFCQGKSGGDRTRCLREHWDHLSKACQDQLSLTRPKSGITRYAACRYDVRKYCASAETPAAITSCLKVHRDKLLAVCAETLTLREARTETRTDCTADIERFCADKKSRRDLVYRCLLQNQERVSEGCQTKLAKLREITQPDKGKTGGDDQTEAKEQTDEDESVDEVDVPIPFPSP